MNDRQLEAKVRKDAARVQKDVSTLMEDKAAQLSRLEGKAGHAAGKAKEDLTTWVEDSSAQLSEGFEKMADDARESVIDAAATVKKDVGHGLGQYNAKLQKAAEKLPGGFGKKAVEYPWVAISIALVVGFMLGSMFRPAR